MTGIFISYAAEDRERVRILAEAIESAGFTVWWDRRIEPGQSFDREIERELGAASHESTVLSTISLIHASQLAYSGGTRCSGVSETTFHNGPSHCRSDHTLTGSMRFRISCPFGGHVRADAVRCPTGRYTIEPCKEQGDEQRAG